MEELNVTNKAELEKKVEELHDESKQLLSELEFIVDEIRFFERLLNSYAFIPHIERLFDESQKLKGHISEIKSKNAQMIDLVHRHDNELGGMMECSDTGCTLDYIDEHTKFKKDINTHIDTFKGIKKRVFDYSNIILENKKNI